MFDFGDVERRLASLLRDRHADETVLQALLEVYFFHIRAALDGPVKSAERFEHFMSARPESPPLVCGRAAWGVGATVLTAALCAALV